MLYLLTQMFLYIIGAALIGWLVAYSVVKKRENRLLEDHQNLQSKHSLLEDYRDRINKDFYALKEQDREKAEEIAHLKRLTEDSRIKSQTFELENSEIQNKISNLNQRSSAATRKLEEDREHYKEEAASANLKVKELLDRLVKIVDEKKQLKHQIDDLSDRAVEVKNLEIHGINSERKKLSAQVELLMTERNDYEERVNNLIEEQSRLSAKVRELKDKEEHSEDLTTQIIDMRNERDDYFNRLRTISNVLETTG